MSSGRFVVLEAVDLAGKTTQLAALAKALRARGLSVAEIEFPDRKLDLAGVLIDDYLRNRSLTGESGLAEMIAAQTLFSINRREAEPKVWRLLARNDVLLSSRYQLAGRAYAEGSGVPAAMIERLHAALEADLPKPDLYLVLDADPEQLVSRSRAGGLDRHEADIVLQLGVRAAYRRLAEAEPGLIKLIDGAGSPDEVTARLLAAYDAALPTS